MIRVPRWLAEKTFFTSVRSYTIITNKIGNLEIKGENPSRRKLTSALSILGLMQKISPPPVKVGNYYTSVIPEKIKISPYVNFSSIVRENILDGLYINNEPMFIVERDVNGARIIRVHKELWECEDTFEVDEFLLKAKGAVPLIGFYLCSLVDPGERKLIDGVSFIELVWGNSRDEVLKYPGLFTFKKTLLYVTDVLNTKTKGSWKIKLSPEFFGIKNVKDRKEKFQFTIEVLRTRSDSVICLTPTTIPIVPSPGDYISISKLARILKLNRSTMTFRLNQLANRGVFDWKSYIVHRGNIAFIPKSYIGLFEQKLKEFNKIRYKTHVKLDR